MSLISLSQFIAKWEGKGIDFEGAFGFQCVDLYRQYVKEVLGFPQSPGVRGAVNIWTSYLTDRFDRIENTPTGVPLPGDIPIWNTKMGGGYGHVAVVISATVNSLTVFEQDGTINSVARRKTYSYTNVLGWLHPKKANVSENDILIPKKTFEELVTKSTKFDELVSVGITNKSDVENLKRLVEESKREASSANEEAKNTRETFASYRQRVAGALNSPQDVDRVISAIGELFNLLEQAEQNSKKDSQENSDYEKQIVELKAEVKRLTLLLDNQDVLEHSTLEDLLKEIVRRFTQILIKK